MPFHALTLGFQVTLKHPNLVTGNDTFQKMGIIFSRFQKVNALVPPYVLLVLHEISQNQFLADFSHPQLIAQ